MHEFKAGDLVELIYQYNENKKDDWSFRFFWQRDDGKLGIKYYGKILEIQNEYVYLELHLPNGTLYFPRNRPQDYNNALWSFPLKDIRLKGISIPKEVLKDLDNDALIPEELLKEFA